MSDYLWDKTGEPEEDVERLEELLGQLRFQPRTFEVPTTLHVAARRAPRTLSHVSWSRLAVAASLLLMLLAGAWLVATKQRMNRAPQMANNEVTPRTSATPPKPVETILPNKDQLTNDSTNNGETKSQRDQKQQDQKQPQMAARANALEAIRRPQREEFVVANLKRLAAPSRQSNVAEANASQVEVAMTTEERAAMEKFMLAMKVTSEKLNYAERQVQSLNESSPQR